MTVSRRVRATGKFDDGDIMSLCNDLCDWSPRYRTDVITDIESGDYRYYVHEEGTQEVDVLIKERNGRKYLTTEADSNSKNNLDNLDDC